jgi:hypothetical protein
MGSVLRIGLLLLAAGGCDALFGLVELRTTDAGSHPDTATDAATCTLGPLGPPLLHAELGTVLFDPQLRGDLLEVFFWRDQGDLYAATRTSTSSAFEAPSQLAITDDGFETDPTVTADGLLLMFRRDDGTTWQITRDRVVEPWSAPARVPGLEVAAPGSFDLAPDGLTIYFTQGEVRSASRPSRQDAFGPSRLVREGGEWPSISGDELELYFNQGGVSRATRATLADQFGAATLVDPDGHDADISPDGSALIMIQGTQIVIRYRECLQ